MLLEIPHRTCNPASRLLDELGLDCTLVDEMFPPEAYHRLPADEQRRRVEAMLQLIVESLDLRTLPVLLASRPYSRDLPTLEVAAACAPTLGEAMNQWVHYLPIWERSARLALDHGACGRTSRIAIETQPGTDIGSQVHREAMLANAMQHLRAFADGPVCPRRVCFTHEAPAEVGDFEAFFDAPIIYGAEYDAIEFDFETLARPTLRPDPVLSQILQSYLGALSQTTEEHLAGPVERVRAEVGTRLGNDVLDSRDVANALGMSERTLRRRLQDARSCYATILDSVRRDRACELLATTKQPLSAIALELGFGSGTSFARAFRRWTGERPSDYRTRLRIGSCSSSHAAEGQPLRSPARIHQRSRPESGRAGCAPRRTAP